KREPIPFKSLDTAFLLHNVLYCKGEYCAFLSLMIQSLLFRVFIFQQKIILPFSQHDLHVILLYQFKDRQKQKNSMQPVFTNFKNCFKRNRTFLSDEVYQIV